MSNRFGLDEVIGKMRQARDELPRLIANQAQNHFSSSFKTSSFDNLKWKEVKRRIPDTPEYKYPKHKGLSRRTKPILIKTGKLRRAVGMSARVVTWNSIRLVVDLPYAERHNEGKDGMPQRKFMGDSTLLREKQVKLINNYLGKIWQK